MKLLNEWSTSDFTALAKNKNLIPSGSTVVNIQSAGDGNMNFTYRLGVSDGSSFIVKQSPPFCAKYPHIPAPEERIFAEKQYYDLIKTEATLASHSPKLLGFDPSEHLLFMEDLGQAAGLENVYGGKKLPAEQNKTLVTYLSALHRVPKSSHAYSNQPMRKLNHDYIFTLPFNSGVNAIDLDQITPGLTLAVQSVKSDSKVKEIAVNLGQAYLHDEQELVHGDYYPRSWLETPRGLFVIDPEFGHFGRKEFDLGVFLAHLMMSDCLGDGVQGLEKYYQDFDKIDSALMTRFAAVEVLRRLLFVAQVPVKNELIFKTKLIESSHQALLSGRLDELNVST